jgi:hypothetical protein
VDACNHRHNQVILLADIYADRDLAGRHACSSLRFWASLPSDYRCSSRYLDAVDLSPSVDPAIRPLVPVAMPESLVIDAFRSTAPAKRRRWPGTYHTAPIFGGRTISAMGSRPQDHMDRDLLLASLIRDRRLRMFRKQCLEMPAWAPAVPETIPAKFQYQAQQLIMLGSHQQHLIERMRDTIHLAVDRCQGEQMLAAMEACLPRGALFARKVPDPGHACGYAKLCPWCHARSVQRLYRHLIAGPCIPESLAGKHLVALRMRVEGGEILESENVRRVRDDYRYGLRKLASRVGFEGGVIIHQATPWIPWYDRPKEKQRIFAHIFSMIGVVASSAVESLDEVIEDVCSDQCIGGNYETAMLPAGTPQALRYLLFGSSYKFDSSELGLVVNSDGKLRYGIQGAAGLEPWFLFDERQAWSYVAAMQGMRLYDTFGAWRSSQAGRQRCPRKRRAKSEYGNDNRQAAFRSENRRRRDAANDRRRELVAVALPYYQKFKDASGKHFGSPMLRRSLNDAGHTISDRDARWLAKHLPANDTRSGLEKFIAKRKLTGLSMAEVHA